MKIPTSPLKSIPSHFDALVVGGGIVGAGVFRDLALHGSSTLLIDKGDFSAQTSRYSSKMLHGGIRYLENFDFSLVWEALHEKTLWLKLTPHLAHEERFILPVFKNSERPLWMIKLGLTLYDLLSSKQNTPHQTISPSEVSKYLPGIKTHGLAGAGVYSDAIVDDLKLTLEVIYDGLLEKNQSAVNHVEIVSYQRINKDTIAVTLQDVLTSEKKNITCHDLVFCVGPFTDKLLPRLGIPWQDKLLTSKGSHIWLKNADLPVKKPLVITTKDKRVIFVIPHKNKVLVGTTEVPIEGDYFKPQASKEEIDYLLKSINEYFPSFNTNSQVLGSFAGIRPLVRLGGKDRGKASRFHQFYQPYHNTYVLIGGKYTTFRTMVQDICRQIISKQGNSYLATKTKRPLRQKSIIPPQEWYNMTIEEITSKIDYIVEKECVRTKEDLLNRCLPWPDESMKQEQFKNWINQNQFLNLY